MHLFTCSVKTETKARKPPFEFGKPNKMKGGGVEIRPVKAVDPLWPWARPRRKILVLNRQSPDGKFWQKNKGLTK